MPPSKSEPDPPPIDEDDLEDAEAEDSAGDDDPASEDGEAEEQEEAEGVGEGAPIPSADEMRAALEWAFEGEDAPGEYLDACCKHALMVLDQNRRMNLTKITEAREVAAKHYLDSWRASRLMPLVGKTVLDLGSGAGFPGIPIALVEINSRFILIDSTQKKADFLQRCVDELELKHTEVVADRAEDHLARNRYDVVILRAISSVRENVRLLRKVRHSLIDLVMLKGPSWSREVRAGEREAERLGFRLDTVWEHKLPGDLGDRAVLVYRAPGGAGL